MLIPTYTSPARKIAIGTALALLGGAALSGLASAADSGAYDRKFLEKAAEAGGTEIAASKIAREKGSAEVRSFAAAMLSDHAKVAEELTQLAASKSITLRDGPGKSRQAAIDKLDGLAGKKFDREYARKIGVAAHQDVVKLFAHASKRAKDPELRAFAARTLPALQHHLQMATALNAALG